MVLDALIKIKNEMDSTLTFRRSCREGKDRTLLPGMLIVGLPPRARIPLPPVGIKHQNKPKCKTQDFSHPTRISHPREPRSKTPQNPSHPWG